MTKLIVAFRNLAKEPEEERSHRLIKKELFIISLFTAIMLSYGR
jgi:hypothetical protein